MKDNIYSTVCPGCGIGCGLYIREDTRGMLSIDYLKSSPINLGKLCSFGMNLHHFYLSSAYDENSKTYYDIEDLIKKTASKLKEADKIAMFSVGNTTCEEQLAFMKLAQTLGTTVKGGISIYNEMPASCHPYLASLPLESIETAKKIVLFIDPYLQYPLLVRRLLIAKENGAHITSVGTKSLHLADENIVLIPSEYDKLNLNADSLIITDLHPYSDQNHLEYLLNLSKSTGSRLFVMKPFVNSEGVIKLSNDKSNYMGLSKLITEIDKGNIKTLILLDTDLIELMLNTTEVINTLRKLDTFVVISSRASPITKIAHILIQTEPLYKKAGSFVGMGGIVHHNDALGTDGIDYMSSLDKAIGNKGFSFESLQQEVKNILKNKLEIQECEINDIVISNSNHQNPLKSMTLKYIFNPFMWFNQPDDNDFLMIDMNLVKELKLRKGIPLKISSDKGEMRMLYKIETIPKGYVLACKKIPIATAPMTKIEVE